MNIKSMLLISSLTIYLFINKVYSGPQNITVKLSTKGTNIAFDQKEIFADLGEKITIKYVNEAIKESEISHNIAILTPGPLDRVFKRLAENDYDMKIFKNDKRVLALSKILEPGKEDSISFTPVKEGAYHFICLMPGHGDIMKMRGILLVKKKSKK